MDDSDPKWTPEELAAMQKDMETLRRNPLDMQREITDLQRQLREAQEELGRLRQLRSDGRAALDMTCEANARLTAQRDAAIERGETLALLNEQVATEAEKAGLGHLPTPVAVEQLRERAEAAEGRCRIWQGKARAAEKLFKAAEEDARAQRALLLRILKVCRHTLESDRSPAWYKMVLFDLGQLTLPAEAQEEGG